MTEGFLLIHPGTGEITAWKDDRPRIFKDEKEATLEIAAAMIEYWCQVFRGEADIDDGPCVEDIVPCCVHADGSISTDDTEWSESELACLARNLNT